MHPPKRGVPLECHCLGTWHWHCCAPCPGAPQACLAARSPSLGTGTPCTRMPWDCPTFTKAILASNPQLEGAPLPAQCLPGAQRARARTAGATSAGHAELGARGEHWGGPALLRLPPLPSSPSRAPAVRARCRCWGTGARRPPLREMPRGHRGPPQAPRSRGGVAARFRSVSPGQSRPSRAPLAPGALYHAVRGGWPSPSRHRAVTEPGCWLSTHLMSEALRCRQPRSRHRLRPRTPSTGGSAPDPAAPAAAGPGRGQPGRCPPAPRCPRLLPAALRCPPGPP